LRPQKIWFGIRDPEKKPIPDPQHCLLDDITVQVGHVERNMYRAGGASCTLLQPLLDNQVGLKNMENCPKVSIPLEKVRSHLRWRR
jgi:hypothetical protein